MLLTVMGLAAKQGRKGVEIFQSNPAYFSYTEFCEKEVI